MASEWLIGGRRAVVAGLLSLCISSPLLAQNTTANDDPPIAGRGLLSIPQITGRGWDLTASVATLYDSNLIRREDRGSGGRITPQVSGGLGLPLGRQQLVLGGSIGRDFFLGDTILNNRNRYLIGGGVNWRLGRRCDGQLGGQWQQTAALVSEQVNFANNSITTPTAGGNFNCRVGSRISLGGGAIYSKFTNSREERRFFNSSGWSYNAQLGFGTPTLGQFSIGGSLVDRSFTERQVATIQGLVDDGVKIYSLRGGYSRSFGSRLQLALGVSYLDVKPEPNSQIIFIGGIPALIDRTAFSGMGFDGAITYAPSARMTATINARRSANTTGNVGALYTLQTAFGADVNYKLGPAITTGLGGTYLSNNYKGSFLSPDEIARRVKDDIWRIYAQVDYQPVPLYSVGIEIAHSQRNSDPSFFSFKSTSALLRLRVNLGRSS